MMGTYVRVQDGRVAEVIDTGELLINDMFHPEFVALLIDASAIKPPPGAGMAAIETDTGWMFVEYKPPAPSPEEIQASNAAERDRLLAVAALAIAPLQDAADLDIASAEEATLLKLWKTYRVQVSRVGLSVENTAWPQLPV